MDYDFITTCNWTSTGTFTLKAYRGSSTNIVTSVSLFYRKKGDANWIETTNGEVVIASTGEWEIANDWNKSGNDCLTHSYYGITAINSCIDVYFDEVSLGATIGDYFLYACWYDCTSLTSMPAGFNLPSGITTVGYGFLYWCWYNCTFLASMPSGFNLPSGITTVGNYFLYACWHNCTLLDDDGYTENITFEFTATNVFGGTCPLIPDTVNGTKETPVNVAVHRILAIVCETGSFSLTGQDTTLKAIYKLVCAVGNYILTGIDVAISKAYDIICETGNYALTGIDVILSRGYNIICEVGNYTLTGINVGINLIRSIIPKVIGFISNKKPKVEKFTDNKKPKIL